MWELYRRDGYSERHEMHADDLEELAEMLAEKTGMELVPPKITDGGERDE